MKLSREEFKKLQLEWYRVLSESGFNDIEELKDGELILKESASFCYRHTPNTFDIFMKEEYYRIIAQCVQDQDTKFKNETHRYILIRHSEGAKIKTIGEELKDRGCARDRKTIRLIIRRYQMAWGLKNYGPKQLGMKR